MGLSDILECCPKNINFCANCLKITPSSQILAGFELTVGFQEEVQKKLIPIFKLANVRLKITNFHRNGQFLPVEKSIRE